MLKRKLFLLLILFSLLIAPNLTFAQSNECQDISDTTKKVECLKNKVNELQGQKRTLSSQIAVMDSQIRLTESRIAVTKQEITELALDINTANKKISNLESALENLTKVLLNRIVVTYEVGRVQPFGILLSSDNVSSFFSRLNYLKIAQQHDKQLIYATQQAKNDYTNQKEIFEAKKKRAEILKASLDRFTAQLAQDKINKQNLLLVTNSDETKYQQLLAQAQAERAVVFGGGVDSFVRDVNQGDVIGFIASHSVSPGCSTGAHLHFEVQKDGSVQNPSSYLKGANFSYEYPPEQYGYYGTVNPSGDLPWPLNETIKIHQGYGSHGFAQTFYPGGTHTGIDMDSASSQVKAVKNGKLYGGSFNCSNGKLFYAKVIHDGGLTTWYLHMIPN